MSFKIAFIFKREYLYKIFWADVGIIWDADPRGLRKINKPYILFNKDYTRKYCNFSYFDENFSIKLRYFIENNFWNFSRFWIYSSVNHYEKKLKIKYKDPNIPFFYYLTKVNAIIQERYNYYSIACAILIALFFSKTGIPLPQYLSPLPNTGIKGKDFFDYFFFAPAIFFTTIEYVNDLLLNETLKNEEHIVRTFGSFLLWKPVKRALECSYNYLLNLSIRKQTCITL